MLQKTRAKKLIVALKIGPVIWEGGCLTKTVIAGKLLPFSKRGKCLNCLFSYGRAQIECSSVLYVGTVVKENNLQDELSLATPT